MNEYEPARALGGLEMSEDLTTFGRPEFLVGFCQDFDDPAALCVIQMGIARIRIFWRKRVVESGKDARLESLRQTQKRI